jgi:hypothetical protein
LSAKGTYKVTVAASDSSAELVTRADVVTVLPDGALYVVGDKQQRRFAPNTWRTLNIENDGAANPQGKSKV